MASNRRSKPKDWWLCRIKSSKSLSKNIDDILAEIDNIATLLPAHDHWLREDVFKRILLIRILDLTVLVVNSQGRHRGP